MANDQDLRMFVPGVKVVVSRCEAREHNQDDGCVCDLMGTQQVMGAPVESIFVGTPTWMLAGTQKRVRLSEITFLKP